MKNRYNIQNEVLLKRARDLACENRRNTVGAFRRRPSRFYSASHVLFYIGAGVNIMLYLINFFACQQALELNSAVIDVGMKTQFRNMSVIAIVLLAAAILITVYKPGKDKCYLFSFAATAFATVPMTIMFIAGKSAVELFASPIKYFLIYLLPSLVSLLSIIYIMCVIRGEKKAINKKYDDIVTAIYEQNKGDADYIMSNEDWDKAIAAYVDNPNGTEKLKKSLRRKKNKSQEDK